MEKELDEFMGEIKNMAAKIADVPEEPAVHQNFLNFQVYIIIDCQIPLRPPRPVITQQIVRPTLPGPSRPILNPGPISS